MSRPNLHEPGDGTVVVEAPGVEAALDAVAKKFGPAAEIVDAARVNRGGVGGFFSRESYRVVVRPEGLVDATNDATAPVTATPAPLAAASTAEHEAVDRVLGLIEQDERRGGGVDTTREAGDSDGTGPTFGEFLRAELEATGRRRATPDEIAAAGPDLESVSFRAPVLDAPDVDLTTMVPTALLEQINDPSSPMDPAPEPLTYSAMPPPPPPVPVDPVVAVGEGSVNSVQSEPRPQQPAVIEQPTAAVDAPIGVPLGSPVDHCPPGSGSVRWSGDALSRIGLPYSIIRPLADLDPDDDLGWVYRLSEVVAPLCGALPDVDLLLAGRDLDPLTSGLGLVLASSPGAGPYFGGAALEVDIDADSSQFLDDARNGRPLHVVCGETTSVVPADVRVVSWHDRHLSKGLHMAVETDAVLGYVVNDGALVRVTPFELALAVRARLERS